MRSIRSVALATASLAALATAGLAATMPALASSHDHHTFIGNLRHTRLVASTVPGNGDVNPYGVAVVRHSQGMLHRDSVLVSNFNNSKNLQGTGSTIVEISPTGHRTVFAHIARRGLPGACPGGIGLTTALVIIRGWVFVGSLPSSDGQAATAKAGCLLVLDRNGHVRETITHGINGPWDATAATNGGRSLLFVTNVLNGTVKAKGNVVKRGTVVRLSLAFRHGHLPMVTRSTIVGSGFSEQTNAAAFVVAPTGLGIGRHGRLYVADTGMNRITVIEHALTRRTSAGTGRELTSGGFLNAPLGLVVAPNDDVLTVNGGNGRIVETSSDNGKQVASRFLDRSGSPPGGGALFGLGIAPHGGLYYVDDAANTLRLLF